MIVKNVKFIKSCLNDHDYPKALNLDIVFIGRSNVGKSSLLNKITNRKNIAIVSKLPGRTRLLNFFLLNENSYLVDLPGYGFANLPKDMKNNWKKVIEKYLISDRKKIAFILIDVRREFQEDEKNISEYLEFNKIPYFYIFTKIDKIARNLLRDLKSKNKENFFVSSSSGEGIQELLKRIPNVI